jgi:hypothetical protein
VINSDENQYFMKQMTQKADIPDDLMVREFPTVKDWPAAA